MHKSEKRVSRTSPLPRLEKDLASEKIEKRSISPVIFDLKEGRK